LTLDASVDGEKHMREIIHITSALGLWVKKWCRSHLCYCSL